MSTSLLYQAFAVRGYRYLRTDYFEGAVVFTIEQDRSTLRCPACGSAQVTVHGGEERLFRLVPIGAKQVCLFFRAHPGEAYFSILLNTGSSSLFQGAACRVSTIAKCDPSSP